MMKKQLIFIFLILLMQISIISCFFDSNKESDNENKLYPIENISINEDTISLKFINIQSIFYEVCGNLLSKYKIENENINSFQDDRPPYYCHDGYFLDENFIEPTMNMGCDFGGCMSLNGKTFNVSLVEYQKIGEKEPPEDFIYTGIYQSSPELIPDMVPDIIRSNYHGDIKITVKYYIDSLCENEVEKSIELTVP